MCQGKNQIHLSSTDVIVILVRLCGAPELSVGVAVGRALVVLHSVEHKGKRAGNVLLQQMNKVTVEFKQLLGSCSGCRTRNGE